MRRSTFNMDKRCLPMKCLFVGGQVGGLKILIDYNSRSSHNMQACPRLFPITGRGSLSLSISPVPWNAWEERFQSAREWRVLSRSSEENHRIAYTLCFWKVTNIMKSTDPARDPIPEIPMFQFKAKDQNAQLCPALIKGILEGKLPLWKGRRAAINS